MALVEALSSEDLALAAQSPQDPLSPPGQLGRVPHLPDAHVSFEQWGLPSSLK